MLRTLVASSLPACLCVGLMAGAAFDPPSEAFPEVSGPIIEGPSQEAEPSAPVGNPSPEVTKPNPKPKPTTDASPGPLLIIPGMPNSRSANKPRVLEAQPAPHVTLSTPLPLDPPAPARLNSLNGDLREKPGSTPLTLESIPEEGDELGNTSSTKKPVQEPTSAARSKAERSRSIVRPNPQPRRTPGLFNWLQLPFAKGRWDDDNNGIHVAPKTSDPAADAALKRRVERQLRDQIGSRVKTFDVRVMGSEVVVRARAARFWQKRTTKSAIESLPTLSGYHTVVEMVD